MADEWLEKILAAYAGEKIKRENMLNQAGANLIYLHGRNTAKQLDLTDDERATIAPFPASEKTVVHFGDPPRSGLGPVAAAIVSSIITAGLVGSSVWAISRPALGPIQATDDTNASVGIEVE